MTSSTSEHSDSGGSNPERPAARLLDLSHTVEEGMPIYPGLPGPVVSEHLSREEARAHYAEGTSFQIGRIAMVGNTGTYLDAPSHRFEGEDDVAGLRLERIAGLEGIVVDVRERTGRGVGPGAFAGRAVAGKAVLVRTGWDRHWGTDDYFGGLYPFLTREGAQHLVDEDAALVATDGPNVDDTGDGTRPAHTLLLGAGIPIVEHLRGLDRLELEGFRFFAVPVKAKGMGSFPVRAFAVV